MQDMHVQRTVSVLLQHPARHTRAAHSSAVGWLVPPCSTCSTTAALQADTSSACRICGPLFPAIQLNVMQDRRARGSQKLEAEAMRVRNGIGPLQQQPAHLSVTWSFSLSCTLAYSASAFSLPAMAGLLLSTPASVVKAGRATRSGSGCHSSAVSMVAPHRMLHYMQ
jgi:hypothetical protein